jgi:dTDP-4-dehydrorhamnose 3,5-epimerase
MKVTDLEIPGVKLIESSVHGDSRGFFIETWSGVEYASQGIDAAFVQDNWSRSARGVLRGLHYQIEHPQGKLVRCVAGEVFDVAVDLRRSSSHFGKWVGRILNEENKHALWIPPGFAHGFLTLSETADLQYKCSDIYFPAGERTLRWDDGSIGIEWPLPEGASPFLSDKDANRGASLQQAEVFE